VRPDWVVVVGDVNSTLACALVTAKLKHEIECRIAHVEAGLRSGDWRMPEEVNRVLTDRVSDLLFTPSADALANVVAEGIEPDRVILVGNVMIDTLFTMLAKARAMNVAQRLCLARGNYVVATLHRPSNVDDRNTLDAVLRAFGAIAETIPVVFPIHPRTWKRAHEFGLLDTLDRVTVVEPIGYLKMLSLVDGAAVVITDSGGLQEESTALGVPCLTLREHTERPVTVIEGTNRLAEWPLTTPGIVNAFVAAQAEERVAPGTKCPEGWDGRAGERIVAALEERTASRFDRTR
jgi:UDP-N-acetylglucosamine 2-epimerase (non-hydrolysing)